MQNKIDFDQHRCDDDEIDLFELFVVLWKRKWIIFAIIIVATVASVIISFMQPKIYCVDAIIQPGRDADGKLVISPKVVVEIINSGAYDRSIAKALTTPVAQIPKFKSSVLKGTDMVKIALEYSEPQAAKKIMIELLNTISAAIQKELDLSIKKTEIQMKEVMLNRNMLKESVTQAKKQAAEIKSKINDLEKKTLEAMNNPNSDALTGLLYTNEIQKGQVYLNKLNDKVVKQEESYQITSLTLEKFRLKLESITSTVIIKEPTIPEKHIKPNKKLIIVLTFVVSFMVAVLLAFLLEVVGKVKQSVVD
ncbi:Wzz/FepE/Etk N-terminal domain-containing protein [uncultured Desulfobacter sp.]|uniref:Wzz/FepE/Etk N-terminal domain-containing protein n=1 Tax=uncultured Desulfobacter sp. TaxID=240139 RepID=UPI0029F5BCDC|nr:Wzz/FepE/Etk N-terminal domain-containing protein [uncultured Desulfobacter sp.]